MDTDNDVGDAFVDMNSLSSLLEEEINHRDRVNFIYGKKYYFDRPGLWRKEMKTKAQRKTATDANDVVTVS